ncbi:hypothetical protein PST407_00517 [Pseudomonas syringae pv. tomato]|uniref:Ankyrin repeat domain-containing protein n=1 Tax=Pseudomonas syringae pv. tomato TaxID=323 RepID=A0AAV1BEX2_PSEUB|nr:hypothetical protein PSTA9_00728 [Pseudomonas syringae pv. tomato]KUR51463.1 hypothetical protein PST407_00517 [Pseudomonas syringae pv. tomato]CAI8763442.1 hypothetical protein DAPPPG215_04470 [Pseudomonas syringae pv. tomato]
MYECNLELWDAVKNKNIESAFEILKKNPAS